MSELYTIVDVPKRQNLYIIDKDYHFESSRELLLEFFTFNIEYYSAECEYYCAIRDALETGTEEEQRTAIDSFITCFPQAGKFHSWFSFLNIKKSMHVTDYHWSFGGRYTYSITVCIPASESRIYKEDGRHTHYYNITTERRDIDIRIPIDSVNYDVIQLN